MYKKIKTRHHTLISYFISFDAFDEHFLKIWFFYYLAQSLAPLCYITYNIAQAERQGQSYYLDHSSTFSLSYGLS